MECPLDAARCAVVLVHYNSARDALACLRALSSLSARPACVIIADNASRPVEREALLAGWRALRRAEECEPPALLRPGQTPPETDALFLALPENSGFAGGNNAALRLLLATPGYDGVAAFWLLNTDTEPAPDALDALCARLNARPDAGLCGSSLCYAHAPDVVQAAGGCTLCPLTGRTSFLMGGAARSRTLGRIPPPWKRAWPTPWALRCWCGGMSCTRPACCRKTIFCITKMPPSALRRAARASHWSGPREASCCTGKAAARARAAAGRPAHSPHAGV